MGKTVRVRAGRRPLRVFATIAFAAGRATRHGATQVTSENNHKKLRIIPRNVSKPRTPAFTIRFANNSANSAFPAGKFP